MALPSCRGVANSHVRTEAVDEQPGEAFVKVVGPGLRVHAEDLAEHSRHGRRAQAEVGFKHSGPLPGTPGGCRR